MSLNVMLALGTMAMLGVTWWGRAVLVDEDRYVRSIAHLQRSPRVARFAGWSIALLARHHPGWRQGVTPRAARIVAVVTRRSMSTRTFGRAWTMGHRWVHRGRGPDRRVAVGMLALAATGEMVGLANRVQQVRLRRASS
jgi:hypothetical protein